MPHKPPAALRLLALAAAVAAIRRTVVAAIDAANACGSGHALAEVTNTATRMPCRVDDVPGTASLTTLRQSTLPVPLPQRLSWGLAGQPQRSQYAARWHGAGIQRERCTRQRCASAASKGLGRLRMVIDAARGAAAIELADSSGRRPPDDAALAQARGCRFVPARHPGAPLASWVEFPVRSALTGE